MPPTPQSQPATEPPPREAQKSEEQDVKKRRQLPQQSGFQSLDANVKFPQTLLNLGFGFALLLSASCLVLSAYYLFTFLMNTNSGLEKLITGTSGQIQSDTLELAIVGRVVIARLALVSCGMFAGVSFGFLGFALFLLGIRSEMNAAAEYEGFSAKLIKLSPGVFIILCATVLIAICVTREIELDYDVTGDRTSTNTSRGAPQAPSQPPITNDNKP